MIKKIPKKLFKINAAAYCGVLIEESVVKEIIELNNEYTHKLKCILESNKEKLIAYDWTMAYDEKKKGDPVYGHYISSYLTVDDRIKRFKVDDPSLTECYDTADREAVVKEIESIYLKQFANKE